MKNLIYSTLMTFSGLLFTHATYAQEQFVRNANFKSMDQKPAFQMNAVKDVFLASFMQTKFDHLSFQKEDAATLDRPARKGFSVDGEPANNKETAVDTRSEVKSDLVNLWVAAIDKFETYDFVQAKKLFYRYVELNPDHELAKFYIALSHLYLGQYGPAASKLSLLNKFVSLENDPAKKLFKDDIKFYFAWSSLKVTNDDRMALVLFNQLNYEGGKYKDVAKEMINLLRH